MIAERTHKYDMSYICFYSKLCYHIYTGISSKWKVVFEIHYIWIKAKVNRIGVFKKIHYDITISFNDGYLYEELIS